MAGWKKLNEPAGASKPDPYAERDARIEGAQQKKALKGQLEVSIIASNIGQILKDYEDEKTKRDFYQTMLSHSVMQAMD